MRSRWLQNRLCPTLSKGKFVHISCSPIYTDIYTLVACTPALKLAGCWQGQSSGPISNTFVDNKKSFQEQACKAIYITYPILDCRFQAVEDEFYIHRIYCIGLVHVAKSDEGHDQCWLIRLMSVKPLIWICNHGSTRSVCACCTASAWLAHAAPLQKAWVGWWRSFCYTLTMSKKAKLIAQSAVTICNQGLPPLSLSLWNVRIVSSTCSQFPRLSKQRLWKSSRGHHAGRERLAQWSCIRNHHLLELQDITSWNFSEGQYHVSLSKSVFACTSRA